MGRISTPEARRPKPGACCYIPSVRELLRRYPRFFLWTALSGLALRLLFVIIAPQVTDDSRVYADVAKNWLSHGIYGTTDSGAIVPTYIRLPGYPAFLAIVFALFGSDNFRAVMLIQVLIDLGTCWLIADLSKRTFPTEALLGCAPGALEYKQESSGDRAAKVAFLLTALCPFLANYSAAVLTETLEVLFTAMALDFAVIGFNRMAMRDAYGPRTSTSAARAANQSGRNAALKRGFVRLAFRSSFMYAPWLVWAVCGLAIGAAILLRPDGGLLLIGIGL
jgi:hypothetical protein